ncbi:hypothetical protein M9435_006563 [Picochlorum sp. BPE23]|nr:hypothetical protein M9435_006563 [Picochlorum sp. BPE23]
MMLSRVKDALRSETAYWVAQNSFGVVVPLLFGLVAQLRFPLACIAVVFYGITSQALSNDNTIGGRIIAGSMFMGATLSGGGLGFSIVTLSWLSRGSGMKALLEIGHELQLPSFSEYFKGTGDFFDAIDVIYKDIRLIVEADTESAPTVYWVLIMLLFAIMTAPWAWMRSTGKNALAAGVSLISLSLACTITIFGLLMPVSGQYAYWTLVFGGFLKASCVSTLGTCLSAMVIYVKSSHDELRKRYGGVLREAGKTISHLSSCMQESMDAASSCHMPLMQVPTQSVSHVIDYDRKMRRMAIKSYLEILQDLQDASKFQSSCKAEPPIPGFSSQWGSNVALYAQVGESIENFISQLGCVELIYLSIMRDLGLTHASDATKKHAWVTSQDVPTGLRIVQVVASVSAGISCALHGSSEALSRMPLFEACSGNCISWRPKPREFWLELHRQLFLIIDDKEMSSYLEKSGKSGVSEILEQTDVNAMPFCLGGSSLVLFTAVESMIDYCIQLDQRIATALNITDRDYFDAVDVHMLFRQRYTGEMLPKVSEDQNLGPSSTTSRILAVRTSPVFKAIVLDVLLGTGVLGIFVYILGCVDMMKRIKALLFSPKAGKEGMDQQQSKPTFREVVFFFKYWFGLVLFVLIVILVGFVAVGDTDSNLYNQVQIAKYLIQWMPFNAPIAVAICLNPTINVSIIKIFLRTTMIAFGGVLGFVTMLNGNLAQNPYFIFWINVLVNAFFSLFSSIDSYARYSIFLVVYTYFSVVTCQYTGKCCAAGDVWEFAGRTISTIAGAAFALAFNWLVMPVYSSHIIFDKEAKLLDENIRTVYDSLERAPGILSQKEKVENQQEERSIDETEDAHLVALVDIYKAISEKTESSFKTRLSIASDIMAEKRANSLENWRFFIFDITLIPLPLACKMAFIRIVRMGLHINVCMHALKSSIYPYDTGTLNQVLLSTMMEKTTELFKATEDMHLAITQSLTQTSPDETYMGPYTGRTSQSHGVLVVVACSSDSRPRVLSPFSSSNS